MPMKGFKAKEKPQVICSYREVATALVKSHNLREGHWRVALTFGSVAAVNADIAGRVLPAAFLPVLGISLVRDDEPGELTVDASVVNPKIERLVSLN